MIEFGVLSSWFIVVITSPFTLTPLWSMRRRASDLEEARPDSNRTSTIFVLLT